uniref:Immunoglobulin V-set domain-containing protein n=1 Tax=Ursus americanus TaxID=9643 RepID=A0A452QAD2_URSAM
MAWTPLLLLPLLTHCPGSSEAVVTQEPSLTVSPEGTVTLTCASSTGTVTNAHYPYWFQQKPGQSPRTLIFNTNSKLSWTPARFSGSLLGGKAALTLTGAQPEDEDEYHYQTHFFLKGASCMMYFPG